RTHDEQRADAAFRTQRIEQFEGALPFPGKRGRFNAPDFGDMFAMNGILDEAVSRKLVGLLAVLAAPLAVPLPGQGSPSARRLTRQTERKRQVDERRRGID